MTTSNTAVNSVRRLQRRTYTPITLPVPDGTTAGILDLAGLVRILDIQPTELPALQGAVADAGGKAAVTAIGDMLGAVSGAQVLTAAMALTAAGAASMQTVGQALAKLRNQSLTSLQPALTALHEAYLARDAQENPAVAGSPAAPAVPAAAASAPARARSARRAADAPADASAPLGTKTPAPQTATAAAPARVATVATTPAQVTTADTAVAGLVSAAQVSLLARTAGQPIAASLADSLPWAVTSAAAPLRQLTAGLTTALGPPVQSAADVISGLTQLNRAALVVDLFLDALNRMPLQPLGLLHMERLEMAPVDVERGELVYSLPMAPGEKVTLAHKEWSVTESEYTDFIEDSLQNFSETGVSQATDLAQSSTVQTQHTNTLSMSESPTSAGGAGVTPPVSSQQAGSTVQDASSLQSSKDNARQTTSLASARTIQDHKISFTVTTVSGVQDFTARVLENASTDHTMLVDYYRRMRQWQNTLFRCGVRMTYDVVLPDPGARVRALVQELQDIDAQLATTFYFPLVASDITSWNWESLADNNGAVLPAPPDPSQVFQVDQSINYAKPQPDPVTNVTNWLTRDVLTLTIPDGYQAAGISAEVVVNCWDASLGWVTVLGGEQWQSINSDGNGNIEGPVTFDVSQFPTSGTADIVFIGQDLHAGRFLASCTVVPTEATMAAWRQRCWAILHDAAYTAYMQQVSQMQNRRATLAQRIAADDALTLRRREREEIMRLVLSWLFPGFDDAGSVLVNLPDPSQLDFASWQQVMEYGEYIKFLQTAIDWDNVSVFLYPYFWDTLTDQDQKLFLTHPDPLHRDFLRAGAVRVVLAVIPGFEEQVLTLLDQGQIGQLPEGSRFEKVVQDVVAANQAYLATEEHDAEGDDPAIPGVKIGSWVEYTPTGALDIDVTMRPVIVAAD